MMVVVVIGTLMLLVVARALVIALVLLSPLAALWGPLTAIVALSSSVVGVDPV